MALEPPTPGTTLRGRFRLREGVSPRKKLKNLRDQQHVGGGGTETSAPEAKRKKPTGIANQSRSEMTQRSHSSA